MKRRKFMAMLGFGAPVAVVAGVVAKQESPVSMIHTPPNEKDDIYDALSQITRDAYAQAVMDRKAVMFFDEEVPGVMFAGQRYGKTESLIRKKMEKNFWMTGVGVGECYRFPRRSGEV